MVLTLLALLPALPQAKQSQMIPRLLRLARKPSAIPSTEERCKIVVGLVKLGLVDEVVDLLTERDVPSDDDLVKAIVPYFDLNETISAAGPIRRTMQAWGSVYPTILAHLATFGRDEARAALDQVAGEEWFALQTLVTTLKLWVDDLPKREDCVSLLRLSFDRLHPTTLGVTPILALGDRLTFEISASEFSEITLDLKLDHAAAPMLTILARYLSVEAGLDPQVQLKYVTLVSKIGNRRDAGCIFAFCNRLVELGQKDAAIKFAMAVPTAEGWLMPSSAIAAFPDLSFDLVEQQRKLAFGADDDVFHKCESLAAIAPYIGDEAWLSAWGHITERISRPDLLDIAFRLEHVLEVLPKEKADQAFADSFAKRFAEETWRTKFFDAGRVMIPLGRYYPADWFKGIELTDVHSDSGTYSGAAFGIVAVRLAKLGQAERALYWLRHMSHRNPEVVAQAIAWVPIEELPTWLDWELNYLPRYEGYPCIWQTLADRWSE